jgi:hypothetical protein
MLEHPIELVQREGARVTFGPPMRDPDAWNSVGFEDAAGGVVRLPPRAGIGVAVVSVPDAQKIDTKSSAGKKGATRTKQGAEAATVKIDLEFSADAWLDVEAALRAISPRGPSRGGPFLISVPALPPGLEAVIVESIDPMGSAIVQKGRGKVTITAKETTFNRGGAAGSVAGAAPKRLSQAEEIAYRAQRELLLNLIIRDQIGMSQALSEEERRAASERMNENSKRVKEIDQILSQSEIFERPTTETETPTAPAKAAPGSAVQGGKLSDLDQGSYDPTKNPDAPSGGP